MAGVVKNLGWMFILFPVLFDCVIVMIMGKRLPLDSRTCAVIRSEDNN